MLDAEVETEAKSFPWFINVISLAVGGALLTAVLFISGKEYIDGYLSYWHLQEGFFSIPFHEVLFQSYIGLKTLAFYKALALAIVFAMLFFVILFMKQIFLWVCSWKWQARALKKVFGNVPLFEKIWVWLPNKILQAKNFMARMKSDNPVHKQIFHLPLLLTGVGFVLFISIFVLVVYIAIFGGALKQIGFDEANRQHEKIEPNASQVSLSKRFDFEKESDMSNPIAGEFLKCLNQRCIVLDGSDVIILGPSGELIARSFGKK